MLVTREVGLTLYSAVTSDLIQADRVSKENGRRSGEDRLGTRRS